MKVPLLLWLGAALALGGQAAAQADNLFLHWPWVPGPSGYRGPHAPGAAPPTAPQPPPMPLAPFGTQGRPIA